MSHLETTIEEMKAYVYGLADSPKHQAAKRCIARIATTDYSFTDTSSGLSIRQLLSLAYCAIHDGSKRSGTLEDAKVLLVEALYEIQRVYNLYDDNQDQGGKDRPICVAGNFNKLMEKLNGIHEDVAVYFITHEGALLKFPRLAIAHAKDYRNMQDLMARLKTDGSLKPIWERIKTEVQTLLWDEFAKAYGNDATDAKFLALINNGQYLAIPDLSAVETVLLTSPGYLDEQTRLSLGEQRLLISLEQHSLWAHRQSNSKAQQAFDNRYGLVPLGLPKCGKHA